MKLGSLFTYKATNKKLQAENAELTQKCHELQQAAEDLSDALIKVGVRNNDDGLSIGEVEHLVEMIDSLEIQAKDRVGGMTYKRSITVLGVHVVGEHLVIRLDMGPGQMLPLVRLFIKEGYALSGYDQADGTVAISRRRLLAKEQERGAA